MLGRGEIGLLRDVVQRRDVRLLAAVQALSNRSLTEHEREALQQLVLDEMYEKGLSADDEPNDYGRQLDDLVGKLENY